MDTHKRNPVDEYANRLGELDDALHAMTTEAELLSRDAADVQAWVESGPVPILAESREYLVMIGKHLGQAHRQLKEACLWADALFGEDRDADNAPSILHISGKASGVAQDERTRGKGSRVAPRRSRRSDAKGSPED